MRLTGLEGPRAIELRLLFEGDTIEQHHLAADGPERRLRIALPSRDEDSCWLELRNRPCLHVLRGGVGGDEMLALPEHEVVLLDDGPSRVLVAPVAPASPLPAAPGNWRDRLALCTLGALVSVAALVPVFALMSAGASFFLLTDPLENSSFYICPSRISTPNLIATLAPSREPVALPRPWPASRRPRAREPVSLAAHARGAHAEKAATVVAADADSATPSETAKGEQSGSAHEGPAARELGTALPAPMKIGAVVASVSSPLRVLSEHLAMRSPVTMLDEETLEVLGSLNGGMAGADVSEGEISGGGARGIVAGASSGRGAGHPGGVDGPAGATAASGNERESGDEGASAMGDSSSDLALSQANGDAFSDIGEGDPAGMGDGSGTLGLRDVFTRSSCGYPIGVCGRPARSLCGATCSAGFDPALIRRVVRAHINEVRGCYQRGLEQDASLAGRVVVDFHVAPSGEVTYAQPGSIDLGEHRDLAGSVGACVVAAVKRWRFVAYPPGFGGLRVSYPFVLRAQRVDRDDE